METEVVIGISVSENNELLLHLKTSGKEMYQHVYREAAGVCWDKEKKSFKSTPMRD